MFNCEMQQVVFVDIFKFFVKRREGAFISLRHTHEAPEGIQKYLHLKSAVSV
jgi:hypothetical protein